MFTEANYSCDCNLFSLIADANQVDEKDFTCGDDVKIEMITLIRPDLVERIIWEK